MQRAGKAILGGAAALFSLFLIDALVFRTNLYPSVIEPDSSAGIFELTLRRERLRQKAPGNLILTIGDSRFAYQPRLANQYTASSGYTFTSGGVAGSDPRMWYYMLRDLDPTARRYQAIAFAVNDYDDEDSWVDSQNILTDLHYLIVRLRWSDAYDFASSYDTWANRWQAFRGCLFKGLVFQQDFQAFLLHPIARIHKVRFVHGGWAGWNYDFVESDHNLKGLTIDWASMKLMGPPDLDDYQRLLIRNVLLRPVAPQTGQFAAYRRQWFGRILERYRGSDTRIMFVRLPRGPVPRPDTLVEKKSSSIRELGRQYNTLLIDEHAFESLEHPELFKDPLHLNREGQERFSAMLVDHVRKALGPPR